MNDTIYRITVDGNGTVFSSYIRTEAQYKFEYYVALGGNVTLYRKQAGSPEEVLNYRKEQ